jgi:hypothetical protein
MTREEAQPAWEKIVDLGFSDYTKMTREQRVWFNIEPLTTDGLIDHYINHGAEYNIETMEDLEYLGFGDIADLMRQVNSYFPENKASFDIDERNEIIGKINEKFIDEIDDKFWDRCDELDEALLLHINNTGIGENRND